jgi:hypothetical protein
MHRSTHGALILNSEYLLEISARDHDICVLRVQLSPGGGIGTEPQSSLL